jgi:hypothetical protein
MGDQRMKRKGESYLGGHTVITLHPKVIEAGLWDQAAEHKRQARNEQKELDAVRGWETYRNDCKEHQSHSPTRRAQQTAEQYYREQLRQIERALHLKPHPRIVAQLLAQELGLLEKLLAVSPTAHPTTRRKITRRISQIQRRCT